MFNKKYKSCIYTPKIILMSSKKKWGAWDTHSKEWYITHCVMWWLILSQNNVLVALATDFFITLLFFCERVQRLKNPLVSSERYQMRIIGCILNMCDTNKKYKNVYSAAFGVNAMRFCVKFSSSIDNASKNVLSQYSCGEKNLCATT